MDASQKTFQKSHPRGATILIFVTVGTSHLSFNRLIRVIDELAKESSVRYIIQTGYSSYQPEYAEWFDFRDKSSILALVRESEMVITHGGFGIIGDCMRERKKVIIVPRDYKYQEAVNPQWELGEYLAGRYESILCLHNVNDLKEALLQAITQLRGVEVSSYRFETQIPAILKDFIDKVTNRI